MAAPTAAPRGCSAATMPWAASGVSLVTRRLDRIMRPPGSLRGCEVLRDVDEPRAGEEEVPAEGIDPHLGGVALDQRPVAAGELLEVRLIAADGHRRAQQDLDLGLIHADGRLAQGLERGDGE